MNPKGDVSAAPEISKRVREESRKRPGDPRRHFLVFCDESGIHTKHFVGFGSLWMPWERRGDFSQLWKNLREQRFPPTEAKWTKVKPKTLPFFLALVDEFFRRAWLMFHCFIMDKPDIDLRLHKGDWDLARRKHFTLFLANKLKRFASRGKCYRIRVDPIASRYKKADEAAEVILTNIIEQVPSLRGGGVIHSVRTVDSRSTPGVQLCDVLLGAVVAARQGDVTARAKLEVMGRIANHLGWPDLAADTYSSARKFNIWRFWDPTSGTPRPENTRPIRRYP